MNESILLSPNVTIITDSILTRIGANAWDLFPYIVGIAFNMHLFSIVYTHAGSSLRPPPHVIFILNQFFVNILFCLCQLFVVIIVGILIGRRVYNQMYPYPWYSYILDNILLVGITAFYNAQPFALLIVSINYYVAIFHENNFDRWMQFRKCIIYCSTCYLYVAMVSNYQNIECLETTVMNLISVYYFYQYNIVQHNGRHYSTLYLSNLSINSTVCNFISDRNYTFNSNVLLYSSIITIDLSYG